MPRAASAADRVLQVNDRGHVVGQDHHNARLTDHDVWLIHELRDSGMPYNAIAAKFEVPKGTIAAICKGRRRGQLPVGQIRLRGVAR